MARLEDFFCAEQSTYPAVSSKVMDDHRRLQTYLKQEERFMPNNYQMRKTVDDSKRTKMLESIYEALFPNSDVFHLAVNLMDRYLSYMPAKSESEYWATAGASTMISMKIRRARRECLNYKHLQAHFSGISERHIRNTEKKIAFVLKWDLNAVTVADFIHELSERLLPILNSYEREKLVEHSLTLANVCLIYRNFSFMSVPPSLLSCACLCDAIQHLLPGKHSQCVDILSRLANVEQDVLLEHQMHVGKVFNQKLSDHSPCGEESDSSTNTPTDIADIEEKEFGGPMPSKGHFNFPSK